MAGSLPFRWTQIESDDYHQYVANLRAVGCPEQVIRDIIVADLAPVFAAERAAIWPRRCPLYWQKPAADKPGPEQAKQLEALGKKHSAILKGLLGSAPSLQNLLDTVFLQVWGAEQELLFLPAERRQAALAALAASDYEEKEDEWRNQERHEPDSLLEYKLKLLAAVLTPEELDQHRLRSSHAAMSLRTELQYFDCTRDEFRKLLELRRRKPVKQRARAASGMDPSAAAEEARELFGEARAREFARVTDMFYLDSRRIAEEQGLSSNIAEQAWQITHQARADAQRIAQDQALSAEQRRQQLEPLLRQADAGITQLLGEKASRLLRRDLANVVRLLGGDIGARRTCCR